MATETELPTAEIDARIAELEKHLQGSSEDVRPITTKTAQTGAGLKKLEEGGEVAAEVGEEEMGFKTLKEVGSAIDKALGAGNKTASNLQSAQQKSKQLHERLAALHLPTQGGDGKSAPGMPPKLANPEEYIKSTMPMALAVDKNGKGYVERLIDKMSADKSKADADKGPKK